MPEKEGGVALGRMARDGEEMAVRSNGEDWVLSWHPPSPVPLGRAFGANAFCVTSGGGVVLISTDGHRWGWPGGRPEGDESWEQVLRREMLEEACARVLQARLLGYCRLVCHTGPERGLVLVRALWRADVELLEWEPQFEIPLRRVVPVGELGQHLWMEEGSEPIYSRSAHEAALT